MFGADGALYASAGDGASFTFNDYGQAGIPRNPLGDPPVGIGGVQTPSTAEGAGPDPESSPGERAGGLKWHPHPGGSIHGHGPLR